MTVLLVTSNVYDGMFRAGEPGHEVLDAELARRGIESAWVLWDDPDVDWAAASVVAVRSTWDYTERAEEFVDWARRLPAQHLLNSAALFEWNLDKSYLSALPHGLGVPTRTADTIEQVRAAVREFGPSVIKPRVGAGGRGVLILSDPLDARIVAGHWVVQPLVESVRTIGEVSVYVIGGEVTAQVQKWPAGDEVRVHEHFGGRTQQVPIDPQCVAVAREALRVAQEICDPIDYARLDLLHHDGAWRVSEIEVIEPGLYLDVIASNAVPFADLVERRLTSG